MPDTDVLGHVNDNPIFTELYMRMHEDLMAAEELVSEARPWDFDYFDNTRWDEWTELSVPMPITQAIRLLTALTTETQQMTIIDPRTEGGDSR